jgi:hypothetical protein
MRKDIEKESLMQCLSWCALRELPQKYDGKNVYIKAVAKVKKADGSVGYMAIQKDKNGADKYIKDFGSVSVIREIMEIYPYLYLDAQYMPKFKTQKKEERIAMLSRLYNKDFSNMSLKELDKEVLNHAIQMHLQADNQRKYDYSYGYDAEDEDDEEESLLED